MKKLILKVVAFVLAIGLISFGVNELYRSKIHAENKYDHIPAKLDLCAFGSSHALYGYNFEKASETYRCFNFALDSQTMSYDARIMETYLDRITENTVVLITVSYFSFYEVETEYDNFESKNQRYYDFLPPNQIKEYDLYTDLMTNRLKSFSVGPDELLKTIFTAKPEEAAWNAESEKIWDRSATTIDIYDNAEKAARRHIITGRRDNRGNLRVVDEELDALYHMIDMVQKKGGIPILITTPYLRQYNEAIKNTDPDFLDEFGSLVQKVVDDTGVSYYDFSRRSTFVDRPDLFINADHLNRSGAAIFTNLLLKTIRFEENR